MSFQKHARGWPEETSPARHIGGPAYAARFIACRSRIIRGTVLSISLDVEKYWKEQEVVNKHCGARPLQAWPTPAAVPRSNIHADSTSEEMVRRTLGDVPSSISDDIMKFQSTKSAGSHFVRKYPPPIWSCTSSVEAIPFHDEEYYEHFIITRESSKSVSQHQELPIALQSPSSAILAPDHHGNREQLEEQRQNANGDESIASA